MFKLMIINVAGYHPSDFIPLPQSLVPVDEGKEWNALSRDIYMRHLLTIVASVCENYRDMLALLA